AWAVIFFAIASNSLRVSLAREVMEGTSGEITGRSLETARGQIATDKRILRQLEFGNRADAFAFVGSTLVEADLLGRRGTRPVSRLGTQMPLSVAICPRAITRECPVISPDTPSITSRAAWRSAAATLADNGRNLS